MANVGFRSWNIPRNMLPPPVFSFIFVSETARFSIRWLWILWGWLQVFNTVQRWVSKMRVSVHSVPLRPELPVATDVAVHYTKKWPVSSFLYPLPSLYLHKFWELKLKNLVESWIDNPCLNSCVYENFLVILSFDLHDKFTLNTFCCCSWS
jgi:hypothetical protein